METNLIKPSVLYLCSQELNSHKISLIPAIFISRHNESSSKYGWTGYVTLFIGQSFSSLKTAFKKKSFRLIDLI